MVQTSAMLFRKLSSRFVSILLCFAILPGFYPENAFGQNTKPRIIITADPELDDNNSMIRFLLYSSDVQVEGLIYASSGFHWKGDGKGTKWFVPGREYNRFGLNLCPCESWRWSKDERFIHDIVEAYAKVYPNLKIHNAQYPSPQELLSKIRYGNIEFDGDISKDSPGSDLIKATILDNKPGPLFITAWGGQSTIARALKSIQEQYQYSADWDAIRKKISKKVILLPSGDQDDTYATYIKPNWPDIEYRQFRDGPNYGYGAQLRAREEDAGFLSSTWMRENVSSRGPLGSLYRVWGDGKQMVKGDKLDYFGLSGYSNEELKKMGYAVWMPVQEKGSWLGEGDNHTFMNMLANGLRAWESATYGGWGGRSIESLSQAVNFGAPVQDTSAAAMANAMGSINSRQGKAGDATPYPNFFPAAENDFAARLHWSVTPKYKEANHEPIVKIEGPLSVLVNAGSKIRLNGYVKDPDGDQLVTRWWSFGVGSYKGAVVIAPADALQTEITIPSDAKPGQTIHIILEATDKGKPSLTRYQRVILTVR